MSWKTLCDPAGDVHVPIMGGDPCACGGERAPWGLCPHEGRPLAFQMRDAHPGQVISVGTSRLVCLSCGEVAQ